MTTLRQVYRDIKAQLAHNTDADLADIEARIIIEERTPYSSSDITLEPESSLDPQQLENILSDVNQRIKGKPLSRIYGEREFWGRAFYINEHTLDPRPDTELLVDLALSRIKDKTQPLEIIDLGTGSGCILVTLLKELPNAIGYGVDLSFKALEVSIRNAERHDVQNRFRPICGSWLDPIEKKFDLIVSNPPYITNQIIETLDPEVKNHDPILALDGGEDGMNPYKIIFPQLKNHLKPCGFSLFEIGYDQGEDVMRLAEDSGFAQRTVHVDNSGNPRVVEISSGDK